MFLFGDGAVRTIRSDINRTTLHNLMTIADGNLIEELPEIQKPRRRPGIKPVQVIEIVRTGTRVKARLVSEPID